MSPPFRSEAGTSAVELAVVVAIVGIAASIAIPQYSARVWRSRQNEAKNFLAQIYAAEKIFVMAQQSFSTCLTAMGVTNGNGPDLAPHYAKGFKGADAGGSTCGFAFNKACNASQFPRTYTLPAPPPGSAPGPAVIDADIAADTSGCVAGGLSTGREPDGTFTNVFSAKIVENSALAFPTDASFAGPAATSIGRYTFTAAAIGSISPNSAVMDAWTIDENKSLRNSQDGLK